VTLVTLSSTSSGHSEARQVTLERIFIQNPPSDDISLRLCLSFEGSGVRGPRPSL